jgi:transcriptional regulator with PAS, ATPase and Fis domain
MTAVLAMNSDYETVSASVSRNALLGDVPVELLRTIAEVLDIRCVLPRVSDLARPVVPHDALTLHISDWAGHSRLEASWPKDLRPQDWPVDADDKEYAMVGDLRRLRLRSADAEAHGLDALIAAGYRSALTIRSAALSQVLRLTFVSKRTDAYRPADVPAARHIAGHVAVVVAHEQLAAAERDRAEARVRAERLDARARAVMEHGETLAGQRRMVGRSEAWQRVLARAMRVASTDTTVFLQGESGTGKELVARFIHQMSPRKEGPFVAINCAALPEQLLESELFGYERGAFTSAQQAKPGQIELAARGVLFLDEVSEMSLTAQAKFLRVLQEREFQRLGGTRTQKANVRVVAASNRDLRKAVERGTFREDLFYRLNVFAIFIPPLRDRKTDVLQLANFFLEKFATQHAKNVKRIATPAIDMLMAYHWPGNVRELENAIERAVVVCNEQVLHAHHLPPTLQTAEETGTVIEQSLEQATEAFEKDIIQDALKSARGNRAKAARLLKTTGRVLNYKVRKYGIDWKRFRA